MPKVCTYQAPAGYKIEKIIHQVENKRGASIVIRINRSGKTIMLQPLRVNHSESEIKTIRNTSAEDNQDIPHIVLIGGIINISTILSSMEQVDPRGPRVDNPVNSSNINGQEENGERNVDSIQVFYEGAWLWSRTSGRFVVELLKHNGLELTSALTHCPPTISLERTSQSQDLIQLVLDELEDQLFEIFKWARDWHRQHHTRRNFLAEQASRNNLKYARRIKTNLGQLSDIITKVSDRFDHTTTWADQLVVYGGHTHEYAATVHQEAANAYQEAYKKLREYADTVIGPPTFDLRMLFTCNGDMNTSGTNKNVTYVTGNQAEKTLSRGLQQSICDSMNPSLSQFAECFSTDLAKQIITSMTELSCSHQRGSITVHIDEPCYIYQVIGSFKTGRGMILVGGTGIYSSVNLLSQ